MEAKQDRTVQRQLIPEAAVEAAARVMYEQDSVQQDMGDFSLEVYEHDARAILEAAAPHMGQARG